MLCYLTDELNYLRSYIVEINFTVTIVWNTRETRDIYSPLLDVYDTPFYILWANSLCPFIFIDFEKRRIGMRWHKDWVRPVLCISTSKFMIAQAGA